MKDAEQQWELKEQGTKRVLVTITGPGSFNILLEDFTPDRLTLVDDIPDLSGYPFITRVWTYEIEDGLWLQLWSYSDPQTLTDAHSLQFFTHQTKDFVTWWDLPDEFAEVLHTFFSRIANWAKA
jgi:hypothetical protein